MYAFISDDQEAISISQFLKHIMELYSNNQRGFTEEFEVSRLQTLWRLVNWKCVYKTISSEIVSETGGGQCVETCMFVCVCVCVCVHNVICLCEGISDDMGRRWWGKSSPA